MDCGFFRPHHSQRSSSCDEANDQVADKFPRFKSKKNNQSFSLVFFRANINAMVSQASGFLAIPTLRLCLTGQNRMGSNYITLSGNLEFSTTLINDDHPGGGTFCTHVRRSENKVRVSR